MIVRAKTLVPVWPAVSFAAMVKLKFPASVGVPLRTPVGLMFKPGSDPEASDHVYGAVPPMAESVWE